MHRKQRRAVLIPAILCTIIATSCKQTTQTITPTTQKDIRTPNNPLNWENTLKGNTLHENLSGKLQIRYNDLNASGQFRIKKNKTIWMSISVLGIEAGRIMATNDSIYFMNRWQREYFVADYNSLSNTLKIPLSYELIQSILLGTDPATGKSRSKHIEHTENFVEIHYLQREIHPKQPTINQTLYLHKNTYHLAKNHMELPNTNRYLHVNYDQRDTTTPHLATPQHCQVIIHTPEKIQIDITFKNITHPDTLTFPFQIPKNYRNMR